MLGLTRAANTKWSCKRCTLANREPNAECAACGHPRHLPEVEDEEWGRDASLRKRFNCVTCGEDGLVRLWDSQSGKNPASMTGHRGTVWSIDVHWVEHQALTGGADRTIRLWNLERGRQMRDFIGHQGAVLVVAGDWELQRVFSGSTDGTVKIWDMESTECIQTLYGHGGSVTSMAHAWPARLILTGASDRAIRLWDVGEATAGVLREFSGHLASVTCVSARWDVERGRPEALSASADGSLRLWDLESGRCPVILEGHDGSISSISVDWESRRALSASSDGTVKLWRLDRQGERLRTWKAQAGSLFSIAANWDASRFLCGAEEGVVQLWEIGGSWSQLRYLRRGKSGSIYCTAFEGDDRWLRNQQWLVALQGLSSTPASSEEEVGPSIAQILQEEKDAAASEEERGRLASAAEAETLEPLGEREGTEGDRKLRKGRSSSSAAEKADRAGDLGAQAKLKAKPAGPASPASSTTAKTIVGPAAAPAATAAAAAAATAKGKAPSKALGESAAAASSAPKSAGKAAVPAPASGPAVSPSSAAAFAKGAGATAAGKAATAAPSSGAPAAGSAAKAGKAPGAAAAVAAAGAAETTPKAAAAKAAAQSAPEKAPAKVQGKATATAAASATTTTKSKAEAQPKAGASVATGTGIESQAKAKATAQAKADQPITTSGPPAVAGDDPEELQDMKEKALSRGMPKGEADQKAVKELRAWLAQKAEEGFRAKKILCAWRGPAASKYEVIKELGNGLEGVAYFVRARSDAKQLCAKECNNPAKAKQEYESLKSMQHQHVLKSVEMIDCLTCKHGSWQQASLIVTEIARGGDLMRYIQQVLAAPANVDITEAWLADMHIQCMEALRHLHSKNVMHNDIKPENLLVMDAFVPQDPLRVPLLVLADFGLTSSTTPTAFHEGDPRYMSPEGLAVRDDNKQPLPGPKADVWSAGAVLFELLSGGCIPFLYEARNLEEFFALSPEREDAFLNAVFDAPVEFACCEGISPEAQALITDLLSKDPDDRPSAAEVLEDPWYDIEGQPLGETSLFRFEEVAYKGSALKLLLRALSSKVQQDHLKKCWDVFRSVDIDFNLDLDKQEFTEACQQLGKSKEWADKAFATSGADTLNFDEFSALTFEWERLDPQAIHSNLTAIVSEMDQDGSGDVDLDELDAYFDGTLDTNLLEDLMGKIDLGGDGKVNTEEFKAFLFGATK